MTTWHVINNKLTHDDLPEPLTGKYISEPYPPFIWYVVDDDFGERLYHNGLPDPIVSKYHFIYNGHDIKQVIYNGADVADVIYSSE
jgi:hypothetical protein